MGFNRTIPTALLALSMAAGNAAAFHHAPKEERLEGRIARERNPIKRAKLEIQLSRLQLRKAIGLYDLQHPNQGQRQLGRYLGLVRKIQQTLRKSGRVAEKHSQGFLQFDIALREGLRRLADLRERVSYVNQAPIAATIKSVRHIRQINLDVLFPSFARPEPRRAKAEASPKKHGALPAVGVATADSHAPHGGER